MHCAGVCLLPFPFLHFTFLFSSMLSSTSFLALSSTHILERRSFFFWIPYAHTPFGTHDSIRSFFLISRRCACTTRETLEAFLYLCVRASEQAKPAFLCACISVVDLGCIRIYLGVLCVFGSIWFYFLWGQRPAGNKVISVLCF